jgi:hypothetical protein
MTLERLDQPFAVSARGIAEVEMRVRKFIERKCSGVAA